MSSRLSRFAHGRELLILALPLIGSHVAQMILQVTNTVMMGWYGVEELAACVLSASTFFILFVLGAGFGQAVMPLAASALEQGNDVEARRVTRMGMWLSIAYGILVLPIFWNLESVLLILGQKPEIAALAQSYSRIAGLGMIPALLVMVMKSFLAAQGRAQIVLWVTIAAAVANGFINWALIFGNWGAPELGIRGAAVSSFTVQAISLLLVALWIGLHPNFRRFAMFQRFWRADTQVLKRVYALGWPIGLTSLMESGLFHAAAIMMGWIGTVELAAHGIALEITAITFMVHVGLSNAATVRAGRAHGVGDIPSLRAGSLVAIIMSQIVGLIVIVTFVSFPDTLIRLFLDEANPRAEQIITYGSTLLLMAALFQIADSAQVMAIGLLRGVQDTRGPMVIAIICYWGIGVPTSYTLAFVFGMGGVGIWLGLVIGLCFAAAALLTRYWRRLPAA